MSFELTPESPFSSHAKHSAFANGIWSVSLSSILIVLRKQPPKEILSNLQTSFSINASRSSFLAPKHASTRNRRRTSALITCLTGLASSHSSHFSQCVSHPVYICCVFQLHLPFSSTCVPFEVDEPASSTACNGACQVLASATYNSLNKHISRYGLSGKSWWAPLWALWAFLFRDLSTKIRGLGAPLHNPSTRQLGTPYTPLGSLCADVLFLARFFLILTSFFLYRYNKVGTYLPSCHCRRDPG